MALWSMQVEHRLIVRYAVSHRLCAFRIALAARARVWVCIAITLLRFRCKKLLKTFSFSFKGFEDYLYLYGKPLFGWAGWAVCVCFSTTIVGFVRCLRHIYTYCQCFSLRGIVFVLCRRTMWMTVVLRVAREVPALRVVIEGLWFLVCRCNNGTVFFMERANLP